MKRVLRWLGFGLAAVLLLLATASAIVYLLSERILRRTYAEPLVDIAVPVDSPAILEGHRLAALRGCSGGCHGSEIEGGVFVDQLLLARLIAPSLSDAAGKYSDADLVRIIRRGVRPDGHSVIGMPSEMFSALTDEDLGKILAYLRSVPPRPGPAPGRRFGPLARGAFLAGKFQPAAERVRRAASLADIYPRDGDSTAAGAYLARTSCTECHGLDLRGDGPAPDLRIAAGYSWEAFTMLMRNGKALGGRELPLMSEVARGRFSHFSEEELRALYAYLIARAAVRDSPSSGTAPR